MLARSRAPLDIWQDSERPPLVAQRYAPDENGHAPSVVPAAVSSVDVRTGAIAALNVRDGKVGDRPVKLLAVQRPYFVPHGALVPFAL